MTDPRRITDTAPVAALAATVAWLQERYPPLLARARDEVGLTADQLPVPYGWFHQWRPPAALGVEQYPAVMLSAGETSMTRLVDRHPAGGDVWQFTYAVTLWVLIRGGDDLWAVDEARFYYLTALRELILASPTVNDWVRFDLGTGSGGGQGWREQYLDVEADGEWTVTGFTIDTRLTTYSTIGPAQGPLSPPLADLTPVVTVDVVPDTSGVPAHPALSDDG